MPLTARVKEGSVLLPPALHRTILTPPALTRKGRGFPYRGIVCGIYVYGGVHYTHRGLPRVPPRDYQPLV
jgi:hypothetical protein